MILETQQSSDITYRVYDYDRKWNGKLRELHVKQSLDVIKTPFQPEKDQRSITHTEGADLEHLETCPYYTVEKYDIHGNWEHSFKAGFVNVSVIEGEGRNPQRRSFYCSCGFWKLPFCRQYEPDLLLGVEE